ncbi:apses-domain-containing protein [Acephala macrosclerotiorum]|nr:apses-domain-containing protein [Acephala macrosclerotiorum]
MVSKAGGPGVYSATYSNIPVYEYQFGEGLKEHVMRRRGDDWINATHILKAAGFDKPARTRILEREVQKEKHEKVQGGYGKYQGTWVPLEQGEALAQRNNVYEKLRTIFEFIPGNLSPPPAPKHTTAKPKLPKKPAVPKWGNSDIEPVAAPARAMVDDDYDNISAQLNDDESMADDATVASASFMAEDDRYDMSQQSTGHRKRKREEQIESATQRDHMLYSDELLDYFMLSHNSDQVPKPEPPINFQPNWIIDTDGHTAMHWAAAMGDVEVMKELRRFGADLAAQNSRGETPLMRSVLFTNCQDKQTMPAVVKELMGTIDCIDFCQSTALHHAAAMTTSRQKHHCARYYIDIILNKMQEILEPEAVQRIIDARDIEGNTAIHIAAKNKARKCVRALMGRGARTNIPNADKVTAEELIQELNESRKMDRHPQASSSPYGPDSRSQYEMPEEPHARVVHHISEAAMSIQGRIAPLMLEKFQDLANSFDEELVEKETSEREAKRILQSTVQELESVRTQILDITFEKESPDIAQQGKERLAHVEGKVTSLIEQQQKMQLWNRVEREVSKTNGHMMPNEDDVGERVMLGKMLAEEQNKRQNMVIQYRDALSMAGAGEKGEQYRRLISKCLGTEADMMNENLDTLLEQLQEDQRGQQGETVMPDDA